MALEHVAYSLGWPYNDWTLAFGRVVMVALKTIGVGVAGASTRTDLVVSSRYSTDSGWNAFPERKSRLCVSSKYAYSDFFFSNWIKKNNFFLE